MEETPNSIVKEKIVKRQHDDSYFQSTIHSENRTKELGYTSSDPFGINQDLYINHNEKHGADNIVSPDPLWHYIGAGIVGSAFSDSAMHSLDTVKTRQQAAPNAVKYSNTMKAYKTILLEEGFRKGWYAGYGAAMLGSIPRGVTFFGTYEYLKKKLIGEYHLSETVTHLFAGLMGDLVTSVHFVPSEVLKARLQLQGRYNNPYFQSGYNYKNLRDAIATIAKLEGVGIFYSGYKATLGRDLPFSAMQFAFYEKFRKWAFSFEKKNGFSGQDGKNLSLGSELLVGGAAGGITGVLTTPLDVVKTRIQTQNTSESPPLKSTTISNIHGETKLPGKPVTILKSSSIIKGLCTIYNQEGFKVLFSGVQPRFVWTAIQSSIMLLVYQEILKELDALVEKAKSRKLS